MWLLGGDQHIKCWNGSLANNRQSFLTLAGERGAWHLMPKDSDITVMEQRCELLVPLSQFTDALASETRVTLSAIKPVLEHIKTEIQL